MRGRKLTKEDCIRKIEKLKLKEAFEDNDFKPEEVDDSLEQSELKEEITEE